MKEVKGDIWDFHKQGYWIVITTNGTVKSNGEAVMGRGVALQAKQRFSDLPIILGNNIKTFGNKAFILGKGVTTLPVKHNWWEKADLTLIEESTKELRNLFVTVITEYPIPIYLVRPGCGNGGLDWGDVRPILEKYLDDRFVVVQRRRWLYRIEMKEDSYSDDLDESDTFV